MNRMLLLTGLLFCFLATTAQTIDAGKYPVYSGTDLGLTYTSKVSAFRIWSPYATEAELIIYNDGDRSAALQHHKMSKSSQGTWTARIQADLKGKFYTFRVKIKGNWSNEVPDPYAKAVGVNGRRAMVVDMRQTNPVKWEADKSPVFTGATSAVIYELHVRDASIAISSGIRQKGKFAGLTEKGTKSPQGLATGLDHLKELGVTHIHLLPSYDFSSVDESNLAKPQYNWGYDPLNYNTPEGSYSSNPYDGAVRIREFKQLVKTFHENGLRVIMDVVYNHTALTENSYFNELVPGYYYRQTADGKFSNATACNNETASERAMMRKFILESVKYWVREYHIDGFRFDLMGVHDIETMNLLSKELHAIRPDILLYGEGWTAGASPLPDAMRALKANAAQLDRIAVFSDDVRDGIKGSVFEHGDRGFASGRQGMEESIRFGIVAACPHPQIDYSKVNYSKAPYAAQPHNTVTYAECHDNHVLWDKLAISAKDATTEQRREMHKLALSIVLTSQGISFLHAGTEFLRTKNGNENSYNAGDSINAIDWNLKSVNRDVFNYVQALIAMRKTHPAFRMTTAKQIAENIRFAANVPPGLIAYSIDGAAVHDPWKKIFVLFNGSAATQSYKLPAGKWKTAVENNHQPVSAVEKDAGEVTVKQYSCSIYFQ